MKIRLIALSAVLGLALFHPTSAFSHHSNVAFEVNKIITVTGVVKEFRWVNPHTFIYLTADDGKGGKVEWVCEGRAPGILLRSGWTRSSVKAGETVTIDMSPAKDGTKTGLVARVTKADGTILANAPPAEQ
jgi:hypothetical protein